MSRHPRYTPNPFGVSTTSSNPGLYATSSGRNPQLSRRTPPRDPRRQSPSTIDPSVRLPPLNNPYGRNNQQRRSMSSDSNRRSASPYGQVPRRSSRQNSPLGPGPGDRRVTPERYPPQTTAPPRRPDPYGMPPYNQLPRAPEPLRRATEPYPQAQAGPSTAYNPYGYPPIAPRPAPPPAPAQAGTSTAFNQYGYPPPAPVAPPPPAPVAAPFAAPVVAPVVAPATFAATRMVN